MTRLARIRAAEGTVARKWIERASALDAVPLGDGVEGLRQIAPVLFERVRFPRSASGESFNPALCSGEFPDEGQL